MWAGPRPGPPNAPTPNGPHPGAAAPRFPMFSPPPPGSDYGPSSPSTHRHRHHRSRRTTSPVVDSPVLSPVGSSAGRSHHHRHDRRHHRHRSPSRHRTYHAPSPAGPPPPGPPPGVGPPPPPPPPPGMVPPMTPGGISLMHHHTLARTPGPHSTLASNPQALRVGTGNHGNEAIDKAIQRALVEGYQAGMRDAVNRQSRGHPATPGQGGAVGSSGRSREVTQSLSAQSGPPVLSSQGNGVLGMSPPTSGTPPPGLNQVPRALSARSSPPARYAADLFSSPVLQSPGALDYAPRTATQSDPTAMLHATQIAVLEHQRQAALEDERRRTAILRVHRDMQGFLQAKNALEVEVLQQQMEMRSHLRAVMTEVDALQGKYSVLQQRFKRELDDRKRLFNMVLELKGNIRVFCRCRPLTPEEIQAGYAYTPKIRSSVKLSLTNPHKKEMVFEFDRVHGPDTSQEEIADDVQGLVTSVVDGYNACIFAYGQTGTGKTYTMEGPEDDRGIYFRAFKQLVYECNDRKLGDWTYDMEASMFEIYNERIIDLLTDHPTENTAALSIRQAQNGRTYVPDLTRIKVKTEEDMLEVLERGSRGRSVAETKLNDASSRSHCILQITVVGQHHGEHGPESSQATLTLVDLAGSERVSRSGVSGKSLQEAQSNNKSLSALGDVIQSLQAGNQHIPYRNSKLTYLLQDSLGGNSKTLMFVHVSPLEQNTGESLCSLNWATRCNQVALGSTQALSSSKTLTGKTTSQ